MEPRYPYPSYPTHQDPAMRFPPHLRAYQGLPSNAAILQVVQQPRIGRSSVGKMADKGRLPIDPPPVVELQIHQDLDPEHSYQQSPYVFVTCNLVRPNRDASDASDPSEAAGMLLTGTTTSSLHRLKGLDGVEGAYFVFNDISAKLEGTFQLEFRLFEIHTRTYRVDPRSDGCAQYHFSIFSEPFEVYGSKNFPGLGASTDLTRHFSAQGLRLRVRKEPRSLLRKFGPASENYMPQSYNRKQLQQEKEAEDAKDLRKLHSQAPAVDSPTDPRYSQAERSGFTIPSPRQHVPVPSTERPDTEPTEPLGCFQLPIRTHSSFLGQIFSKRQRTGQDMSLSQTNAPTFEGQDTYPSPALTFVEQDTCLSPTNVTASDGQGTYLYPTSVTAFEGQDTYLSPGPAFEGQGTCLYPTNATAFEGQGTYKSPAPAFEGQGTCLYPTNATAFEGQGTYKSPAPAFEGHGTCLCPTNATAFEGQGTYLSPTPAFEGHGTCLCPTNATAFEGQGTYLSPAPAFEGQGTCLCPTNATAFEGQGTYRSPVTLLQFEDCHWAS